MESMAPKFDSCNQMLEWVTSGRDEGECESRMKEIVENTGIQDIDSLRQKAQEEFSQKPFPTSSFTSPVQEMTSEFTKGFFSGQKQKAQEESKKNPFQEQSINKREHLGQFLEKSDADNKPWSPKELVVEGYKFKTHTDPELLDFLRWVNKNPEASDKEIQEQLSELSQNCNTNAFLGLSKMGAMSKEQLSPRAELRNQIKETGLINFATLLGINDVDHSLNDASDTHIPKGTVVFVVNRMQQKRNPFLHVFFAEQSGKNSENIYRSLNEGQEFSELQSLEQVLNQGNYNVMNSTLVFSRKYV